MTVPRFSSKYPYRSGEIVPTGSSNNTSILEREDVAAYTDRAIGPALRPKTMPPKNLRRSIIQTPRYVPATILSLNTSLSSTKVHVHLYIGGKEPANRSSAALDRYYGSEEHRADSRAVRAAGARTLRRSRPHRMRSLMEPPNRRPKRLFDKVLPFRPGDNAPNHAPHCALSGAGLGGRSDPRLD